MADHLSNRSSTRYRSILSRIEECKEPITKANIENTLIGSMNAWDISQAIEGFIFDHVSVELYERRAQLCNQEESNGFEAWR